MKILHLEDNVGDAELIREILAAEFPSCVITVASSRDGFLTGIS